MLLSCRRRRSRRPWGSPRPTPGPACPGRHVAGTVHIETWSPSPARGLACACSPNPRPAEHLAATSLQQWKRPRCAPPWGPIQRPCLTSARLTPCLKRARGIEELIPWLYPEGGGSTGDYQEALAALLGDQAKGLSANTMSRLKKQWEDEHAIWQKRDLADQLYVYWWADGVYSYVRMDDRLCLLVIIGVTKQGHKELVVVENRRRESEASWKELLTGLRACGLTTAPKLAVGDGTMGFWAAVSKVYPETERQRCWVHKRFFVTSCGFGLIQQAAHGAANQVDHRDEVGLVPVAACRDRAAWNRPFMPSRRALVRPEIQRLTTCSACRSSVVRAFAIGLSSAWPVTASRMP